MVWGPGTPDRFRGVVRRVDEGGEERKSRLARRGDLSRQEELDGTVERIVGEHATWFRDSDTGVMRVRQHEHQTNVLYSRAPIGGLDVGGPRGSWERWT